MPTGLILWVANKKLKGIATISSFKFNTDEGQFYTQVLLYGEQEPIEVWMEDFELFAREEPYKLAIQQVRSTKPWLETILTQAIQGREWDIPKSHSELIWTLFANRAK